LRRRYGDEIGERVIAISLGTIRKLASVDVGFWATRGADSLTPARCFELVTIAHDLRSLFAETV
jgi:hypothetical protein